MKIDEEEKDPILEAAGAAIAIIAVGAGLLVHSVFTLKGGNVYGVLYLIGLAGLCFSTTVTVVRKEWELLRDMALGAMLAAGCLASMLILMIGLWSLLIEIEMGLEKSEALLAPMRNFKELALVPWLIASVSLGFIGLVLERFAKRKLTETTQKEK